MTPFWWKSTCQIRTTDATGTMRGEGKKSITPAMLGERNQKDALRRRFNSTESRLRRLSFLGRGVRFSFLGRDSYFFSIGNSSLSKARARVFSYVILSECEGSFRQS